ncbi:MAG: hypothetical protein WCX81_02615 [Monoglobales bacterium]
MSSNFIGDLWSYLVIAFAIIVAGMIIGSVVWAIVKLFKKNSSNKSVVKAVVASVLSMLLCGATWIFNMGWYRFIMMFSLIPYFHVAVFFIINILAAKYKQHSRKLSIMNVLFFVTYIAFYIFLPDGGDIGGAYAFFGLIHDEVLINNCYLISFVAILAHIVLLILQIIKIIKIRKSIGNTAVNL